MSTRKFAVIVVTTMTLGATILTGASANADDSTATSASSAPAPVQRPDADPEHTGAKEQALSAGQIAARDQFAKRMGVAAALYSGPWLIVNLNSGLCLTIYQASENNDANAVQFTCDTTWPYNERWYREKSTHDGWVHLVNENSNLCLTVYYARTDNDAPVVQFACDWESPFNEEWYVDPLPDGQWVHITNYNSLLCLTVSGASTNNEANAVQFGCDSTWPYNEYWKFKDPFQS